MGPRLVRRKAAQCEVELLELPQPSWSSTVIIMFMMVLSAFVSKPTWLQDEHNMICILLILIQKHTHLPM